MPAGVSAGVEVGSEYLGLTHGSQARINELRGVNLMAVNAPAGDGR
jgi:hypothetical protein